MNMILGIVLFYTSGSLSGAHVAGAYASQEECRAKVTEVVKQKIPKDSLPKEMDVYVLCFDTTRPKADADTRHDEPKPPSTSL